MRYTLIVIAIVAIVALTLRSKFANSDFKNQSFANRMMCGHWCIQHGAELFGLELSPEDVAKQLCIRKDGNSLSEIDSAFKAFGFNTKAMTIRPDDLDSHVPCLVHLTEPAHFVIAARSHDSSILFINGTPLFDLVHSNDIPKRMSGHILAFRQKNSQCTPSAIDIGYVEGSASDIDVSFTVRNTTKDTLKIIEVVGNCSCLTPDFTPKELAPGTEMDIRVRMSFPLERRETNFRHEVYVRFDGNDKARRIVLRGKRRSLLSLEQKHIDFGVVTKGDAKTLTVPFLLRESGKHVLVSSSTDFVNVTLRDFNGVDGKIAVRCQPAIDSTDEGSINGILLIHDEDGKLLGELAFSAKVVEGLRAFPPVLVLKHGQTCAKFILVASKGENKSFDFFCDEERLVLGVDYSISELATKKWEIQIGSLQDNVKSVTIKSKNANAVLPVHRGLDAS